MKLDAGASRAMDQAREEARVRRHRAVEPAHVMMALFASPKALEALAHRAIDASELSAAVEADLASREELGGYRDAGVEPEIAAGTEEMLARALPRKKLFDKTAGEAELLAAVLDTREVAESVLRIQKWDDSATAIETRARALATTKGHRLVGLEHAMHIVIEEPFFSRALDALGGDAERLHTRLDEELAKPDGPVDVSVEAYARACARARHREIRLADLNGAQTFAVRVLEALDASPMLARSGVDSVELAYVITNGSPALHTEVAPEVPAYARVEVVLHDHEGLGHGLLQRVLRDAFGIEEHLSTYEDTLTNGGAAVVGAWPAREARERRARALLLARKDVVTPRITLRRTRT